jgi:hypothetical protein
MLKKTRLYLFILFFPLLAWSQVPSWMQAQIEGDLRYFKEKSISLSQLDAFYVKEGKHFQLVKYTVQDNEVFVDNQFVDTKRNYPRIFNYFDALTCLCKTKGLPDVTFLISINDGLNSKEDIPVFAMCKMDSDRIILLPDYEALGTRFQVLKGVDITKIKFPWEEKMSQLIWRGSTAQLFVRILERHLPRLSRLKLCELSEMYPELIDAKYTIFTQGGEKIPYLKKFQGDTISFKDQMYYKYHILIDGNVCPYTKSGWKFFTNSLIFKPHSKWVQWYYGDLKPYVHYVPVKEDLSDLVEKLHWAQGNDAEAKKIATNCREFALNHLTLSDQLLYLYHAVMRYHALHFIP